MATKAKTSTGQLPRAGQRGEQIAQAVRHLRRADPVMRDTIRRVGPFTLRLKRDRFATLACSILSQQISGKAARSIIGRLKERLAPQRISPEALGQCAVEELRALGISRQKATYLLDLADKTRAGLIRFDRFSRMDDEQIIEQLVQVKGIGVWTAQMLLMFSLGRWDVLPHDDLGIRMGIRHLYGLEDLPNKQQCLEIAMPWRPYATVASWYCWRSLDLP